MHSLEEMKLMCFHQCTTQHIFYLETWIPSMSQSIFIDTSANVKGVNEICAPT